MAKRPAAAPAQGEPEEKKHKEKPPVPNWQEWGMDEQVGLSQDLGGMDEGNGSVDGEDFSENSESEDIGEQDGIAAPSEKGDCGAAGVNNEGGSDDESVSNDGGAAADHLTKRTRAASSIIKPGVDENGKPLPQQNLEPYTPAQKSVLGQLMKQEPSIKSEFEKCQNMAAGRL